MTWATGVVQTSPSPDSLPLRAASETVSATAAARWSSTTNVRSAFGRKRDSKTRPRYSCVIPRWRPCPTASITVTPTWPVCSSTASITISTRSRSTTASTLTISPPPRFVVPETSRHATSRASGRSARASRRRGSRNAARAGARLVLREDARLERPDPTALGALDQRREQLPSHTLAASLLSDVGAHLGHTRVALPRRHRCQRDPADDPAVPLRHEAVRRQVRGIPRLPRRHLGLEGRIAGPDPFLEDARDLRPVVRPKVAQEHRLRC